MKLSKAIKSFEMIAAVEGISVAEVREQIRLAIEPGCKRSRPGGQEALGIDKV